MIYKATRRISEEFDRRGFHYRLCELDDMSLIEAGFSVNAGPFVLVRFLSRDEDNDVALRIFDLIHKVPEGRCDAVRAACSKLNEKVRFLKFYLDSDNNVVASYDLPQRIDEESVGPCCAELFVRCMQILDGEFHCLAEAIYSPSESAKPDPLALLKALRELREHPLPDAESA